MEETSPEELVIHQQQFCLPQDLLSGKKLNSPLFNPFLPPSTPHRTLAAWGPPQPQWSELGLGRIELGVERDRVWI